jgi:hypothetical protein
MTGLVEHRDSEYLILSVGHKKTCLVYWRRQVVQNKSSALLEIIYRSLLKITSLMAWFGEKSGS